MARKFRITKRTPIWVIIIFVFVTVGQQFHWFDTPKAAVVANQPGLYKVVEVYDGDTIAVDMNGKIEKIRIIGVDTPETHDPRKAVQCYGPEASAYSKQALTNQTVRLEADALGTNRDRYNRLLRYVYLADGRLWEAELIKNGYGFAYLGFPISKHDELKNLQTEAKAANVGLWAKCPVVPDKYGSFTSQIN